MPHRQAPHLWAASTTKAGVLPMGGVPMGQGPTRRLYRSRRNWVLAGVAGGIAEYLDIDPTIVRVLWVIGAIVVLPMALDLYLALALIMPPAPEA